MGSPRKRDVRVGLGHGSVSTPGSRRHGAVRCVIGGLTVTASSTERRAKTERIVWCGPMTCPGSTTLDSLRLSQPR